ncbi:MAG: 3-oxoacyl-[acyl-carrier protein] reductase [Planctomycetota bacterium]|jgi:3-oxoacyl-[acyl-carrier protein] reductase
MDLGLDGKVVFLTGASGGIGRAAAEAFAAEGARLVLHGQRQWEELSEWLEQQPWKERAMAVRADITLPAEVEAAFAAARAAFGRVDVCVANAGIWPPLEAPLADLPEERIKGVVEVNLMGSIWTARAFLKQLEEVGPREDGDGACLLFTGSTAGRFGEKGHADYAASKAALVGLMLTLKNEIVDVDPYGRVNVVEPGWTVTDMTRRNIEDPSVVERVVRTMPVRQLARAVDIARSMVMLASPVSARHVSGQVLTVAGGMEGRVLWEEGQVVGSDVLARLKPDA